jgi:type II secretory pathway predicted ATPase ExeA
VTVPNRSASTDALESLEELLRERYGRFILVLGDFGTGKTFLMRQLNRSLTPVESGLVPILIPLRELEKAQSLEELLAQHLARSGMQRIEIPALQYMIRQGLR